MKPTLRGLIQENGGGASIPYGVDMQIGDRVRSHHEHEEHALGKEDHEHRRKADHHRVAADKHSRTLTRIARHREALGNETKKRFAADFFKQAADSHEDAVNYENANGVNLDAEHGQEGNPAPAQEPSEPVSASTSEPDDAEDQDGTE